MPRVTVSSKRQITLPAEIVRKLGIEAGDKLAVELIGDRIIAIPEPESWVDYFAGSMKGVYGDTKAEIDRYVAEERAGWDSSTDEDRTEWRERFADLYATDQDVERVVDVFRRVLGHAATRADLARIVPQESMAPILERLVEEGWVRRIPMPHARVAEPRERYRLVREAADSLPPRA